MRTSRNILIALLSLCALAQGGEPRVALRYFRGGAMPAGELDVLREFERRYPDVKVVAGVTASRDMVSDPQRLLCAIAGGDPPDVVYFDRYAVAEWAARGAFRPLDDLIERDKGIEDGIHPEDFFEPAWGETQWQGHTFAIPASTDCRALYYNKDLLRAAGLVDAEGEARPPRTWDELEEYTVKLSELTRDEEGRIDGIRRAGFIPNYGNVWFYFYSWMNGGSMLDPTGRTCTLASPENVEAMRYVVKLYDLIGGAKLAKAYESSFQGAELDPFLTGRIAMKVDGNWTLNNIGNYKRELNFGVAPAPLPRKRLEAGAPYISWAGGWAWVIPKGSKHPEESWKLIQFLATERAAVIVHDAGREAAQAQGRIFIPSLHASRKITQTLYERYLANDPSVEQKFRDAYQVFANLLPDSKFRPVTPVGMFLWNQQVRAMDAATLHDDGLTEEQLVAYIKERMSFFAGEAQRELERIYRIRTEPRMNWTIPLIAYIVVIVGLAAFLWWRHRRASTARGYFRAEYRAGVVFALPWIIGFVCFTGGPIIFSFVISFCEYDVLSPGLWVGARNYTSLVTEDPVFWKSLWNTLYMLIGLPIGLAVGLGLAMLLNANVKGMSVWRLFFYLPAIMPAVAGALLWVWIFQPTHGLLNQICEGVGLNWLLKAIGVKVPIMWLQDPATAKMSIILMGLWGAGGGMIIWLAGLKGIPQHLYEAAEIDGAGAWRRFRAITLPMLSPYIFFNLLMGIIGTLQQFQSAYIMTAGGPNDSTLFFGYHLFNNAFRYFRMGQASAMAWVLCLIVMVITLVQLKMAKIWVHYEAE